MTVHDMALFASQLAMGFALAASVGLRAFLPLFAAGLLAKLGYVQMGASFAWMSSTPALLVFGSAVVFELLGDKFPAVDHLLDSAGIVVKPAAATLLAASMFTNVDPLLAATLGIVTGGATAGTVHAVKSGGRVASSALTAGIANPVLSLIEDAIAAVGVVLALVIPVVAALLVFGLLAVGVAFFVRHRNRKAAITTSTAPSAA